MSKIPFTKMHGCGNDYIYVNAIEHPIADPVKAAILWSDRNKGIGSDGLVLIDRSPIPEADYSMRIFNADGSEAKMCGNASRCIGKYLYERGLITDPIPEQSSPARTCSFALARTRSLSPKGEGSNHHETQIRLLTKSGIKTLFLHIEDDIVESVTVDMGEPILEDESLFNPQIAKSLSIPLANRRGDGGEAALFVSMGNPHYVIFTDDVNQVGETGRILEHHPAFPQRCNIEFAQITDPSPREGSGYAVIRTRVWERGSGITQACGTGACATAVAAFITSRAGRQSQIVMDGGTLSIELCESDNHVYMTGPAEFVFDGETEYI